jgi:hypothetical protein
MLRLHTRAFSRTARAYTVRRVSPSGAVDRFAATPRELVDRFALLPRDCRLLSTSNAHIAVREHYFLFRFPPFTGVVTHDAALLIAENDCHAAADSLQQCLVRAATVDNRHALSFEHRVLEAVLHEDTMHKLDRFTRLGALIDDAISSAATDAATSTVGGVFTAREASLYRLLTLSRACSGLDPSASAVALSQRRLLARAPQVRSPRSRSM